MQALTRFAIGRADSSHLVFAINENGEGIKEIGIDPIPH